MEAPDSGTFPPVAFFSSGNFVFQSVFDLCIHLVFFGSDLFRCSLTITITVPIYMITITHVLLFLFERTRKLLPRAPDRPPPIFLMISYQKSRELRIVLLPFSLWFLIKQIRTSLPRAPNRPPPIFLMVSYQKE